jgi:hypothetical protein
VLIYKEHKQAVKGLDQHLKDAYELKTKKEQQLVLDQYSLFVLLLPKDVLLLPNNCTLFKALKKLLDRFLYSCKHISINYKFIQEHCNTEHNWQVSKADPTYWTKVKIQTFFKVRF